LDKVRFQAAFDKYAHLLPADIDTHPMVAFKYSKPLGLMFKNASRFGKQPIDIGAICAGGCLCHCGGPWQHFIPPGQTCIIKGDSRLLDAFIPLLPTHCPSVTAADVQHFKALWEQGAKYRAIPGASVVNAVTRMAIIGQLSAGLDMYSRKQARQHPTAAAAIRQVMAAGCQAGSHCPSEPVS
jgi:hypothetical protein